MVKMPSVNVLVVSRIDLYPGFIDDIKAVDPRVSVKDGVRQVVAELREEGASGVMVDRLEKQANLVKGAEGNLDGLLGEAEVVFGNLFFPDRLVSRAPNLKWVHIANAGLDRYLSMEFFNSKSVVITNSRGCVAVSIAEHVLTLILMLAKKAPRLMENKQKKRWERFITLELRDRVVGLVGLGAIGTEVARLAKGIGMKVVAVRKSAVSGKPGGLPWVDKQYSSKDLHRILHDGDFVVIAAPLTAETREMIGEAELKAMKPSAYLINIARGPIVNEPVLIRALQEGWIAGAGLDVFTTEPLPPDSELWKLPNVILSPHMSGNSDKRPQHIINFFCNNLKRYLSGQEMLNVIDREKSY